MLEQDLDRKRLRRRLRADEWQVVFADWQVSGLSKTRYCKVKGITPSCFARWYQRLFIVDEVLDKVVQSLPKTASPADTSFATRTDCVWPSFIPVRLDGDGPDSAAGLKLEIVLSKGHRVCVEGVLWRDVVQFLSVNM